MRKRALICLVVLTSTCFQACSSTIAAVFNNAGTNLNAGFGGVTGVLPNTPNFGVPLQQNTGILQPGGFAGRAAGGGPP